MNKWPCGILVALLSLITTVPESAAQDNRVAVSESKAILDKVLERIPLPKALKILSQRHRVFFTYDLELLRPYQVTLSELREVAVEEHLRTLLADTDLAFKRIGELNYVIFQHSDTEQPVTLEQLPLVRRLPPRLLISRRLVVKGKVTDQKGQPLIGVNVLATASDGLGTVTDKDGQYQLALDTGRHRLTFSYMGFSSREVVVANQGTFNVTMHESTLPLEQVVVVGYGRQRRKEVTGAITTIGGESIKSFPSASFERRLQGLASGVQVTTLSGAPGAPTRVLVRGTNSLFSGTEPLWIIDGMILSAQGGREMTGFTPNRNTLPFNPMATLNPNDIESIEVLKDAAATAVYGSRGANGVIIVTTKNGRNREGNLSLSVETGVSEVLRGPQEVGFANGPEWLSLADAARRNSGLLPFDPNEILDNSRDPNAILSRDQVADTDWFDLILRSGAVYDVNLSGSGSSDRTSYYVSGNYHREQGVLKGDALERFSLRSNLKTKPSKNLELGTNLIASYSVRHRAPDGGEPGGNSNFGAGGYRFANTSVLPILPVYHPELMDGQGNRLLFDPLSGRNLMASFDRDNYINDLEIYRLLSVFSADYQLPFVPGLRIDAQLGIDFLQSSNIEWAGRTIREESKYGFDFSGTFTRLNYNLYTTYERAFAETHRLKWTFGTETTQEKSRDRNVEAQGLFGNQQDLGSPADIQRVAIGLADERKFRGYFSRLNYQWKDRYLMEWSFRRDASSIFRKSERWGNFLAVSGGWVLSEEPFLKTVKALDLLKLKGSLGQTGNSAIHESATETGYAGWGRYGNVGAGDLLSNIGNESVTWETTHSMDLSLDFEMSGGKLSGRFGYYHQLVEDMLYRVPVPVSAGIFTSNPTIWDNIGDMRNQGWEFELQLKQSLGKDLRWQTGLNLTTNRNEVIALGGGETEIYLPGRNALVTAVGQRLGFYRLAKYAGIHPEGGYEMIREMDLEYFAATGQRRETGNLVPATRANLEKHLFDLTDKSGLPTYFGGWSNLLKWKGLELFALISFSGGNYLYDDAEKNASYVNGPRQFRAAVLNDYWTPDNKTAKYPSPRWNSRYSIVLPDGSVAEEVRFDSSGRGYGHDKFLYRGDYARLRTLSLSYRLPALLLEKIGIRTFKMTLSANNLLTLTNFPGFDPEALVLEGNRNLNQGWIGIQFPQVKTYHFRLDLSF